VDDAGAKLEARAEPVYHSIWGKDADELTLAPFRQNLGHPQYLPLARRIAADENVVSSDTQLLAAIAGNNGSFRSVIFSVLRLAKRTARQNTSDVHITAATIQQAAAKR